MRSKGKGAESPFDRSGVILKRVLERVPDFTEIDFEQAMECK